MPNNSRWFIVNGFYENFGEATKQYCKYLVRDTNMPYEIETRCGFPRTGPTGGIVVVNLDTEQSGRLADWPSVLAYVTAVGFHITSIDEKPSCPKCHNVIMNDDCKGCE